MYRGKHVPKSHYNETINNKNALFWLRGFQEDILDYHNKHVNKIAIKNLSELEKSFILIYLLITGIIAY